MSASLEIAAICLASVTSRIGFLFLALYKSGLDSPKKKSGSIRRMSVMMSSGTGIVPGIHLPARPDTFVRPVVF